MQLYGKHLTPQEYRSHLTDEILALGIAKIQSSFSSLPAGFYKSLTERLRANKVTNEEFADSVDHVIDTCEYPNPQVASFIKYIIENRVPPEERPEVITEDQIIIDPKKEKEIEDFRNKLLAGGFEEDSEPDPFDNLKF